MKFNVATTPLPLSLERQGVLQPKLDELGISYQFYEGKVTELRYDDLYHTAKNIINDNLNEEYVIFAEDDLILIDKFSISNFYTIIQIAQSAHMDVLATGCLESYGEIETNENRLIEISGFRGTQLVVIFKSCYECLLDAPSYNHFEDTISKIQPKLKIGLTVPFYSKQREDCPSLITGTNNNRWFDINERKILEKLGR